jgi:iron complex outermembrane receptor protein
MTTRNHRHRSRPAQAARLALLSFTAVGGVSASALAAEVTAAPPPDQVEQIVVTAQKRAENLQNVPVSIQSLTANTLDKIGAKDVRDIELIAPSVTFADGSEQGRTGIRGIVDYSRNAGYDSRVGLYIDGVYLGRSYLNNETLLGVQQIDVLRGPQGTLFGKDTDAGVIAITTKKPTDQFSATAQVEAGNYGEYRVAGLVNGEVEQDLDAELAVTQQGSNGYYHNELLNKENEGTNQTAERLELRYHPGSRLDILFSVDDSHQNNSTLHYTYVPKPGTNVFDFNSYNNDYAVVNSYGDALTINYNLDGGYKVTSITAFRGGSQLLDFNNETGPVNLLTPVFHEVTSQYSEEARVASPVTRYFDFVAGVYLFHQLNDENTKDIVGPGITSFAGGALKIYANKTIPYGADVETNSYAGFFNGNLRVTDKIEFNLGLRYTEEIKTLSNFYATDPYGVFGGNFKDGYDQMTNSEFTPKVGVNLHPMKNLLLFGDVGTGFKGGAFNIDNTTPSELAAGIRVQPETVTSYEIGLKSDFLEKKARVNITVFREDFKKFQVFTFVTAELNGVAVSTTSLANAGSVQSQGVEFEGAIFPFDGLSLSANYTYDDSHFVSYPGGGGTVGTTILSANGAQTPYAPYDKAYLSGDYTHPLSNALSGFVHLGYEVQTSENFDPKHVNPVFGADYDIPGYGVMDARIGVTAPDKPWTLSLWGKNLTDERYIIFANRTALTLTPAILYAAPLTFGFTLTVSY